MGSLLLRPATTHDGPALSRLGTASFVAKFGQLYDPQDLAVFLDESLSPETVAAELNDPSRLYCLAESEGMLTGYAKLGLVCGFPEHAARFRTIELKGLYTHPARTGQGIGARLLDWALAEARGRGFDEMQLSVFSGNDGAQRFYARYGFEKVADVTFRVGRQLDHEFLLARDL